MKQYRRYITLLLTLLVLPCSTLPLAAQAMTAFKDSLLPDTDTITVQTNVATITADELISGDSLINEGTEKSIGLLTDSLQTAMKETPKQKAEKVHPLTTFVPDPQKATWSAIVFPGGGQIYNRKYWKLPIIYGGFLGCAYALNWNNQMYSDYSQAYLDIMDDDPNTASYEDFLPPHYNVNTNMDYLKRVFKNRKDKYRRYRDMSIFGFIGVYLLSIIDAYVDAELSHFDISEDLSLHISPDINQPVSPYRTTSYGLQCSFSF